MSGLTAGSIVVVALLLLVFFHELGHFLAARLTGIRATKFYVGFPPAIARFRKGETEYGIGAVMLGGYVKLPGMFEPEPEDVHWRIEPLADEVVAGITDPALRLELSSVLRSLKNADTPALLSERCGDAVQLLARVDQQGHDAAQRNADQPVQVFRRKVAKLRKRLENVIDDAHPEAYWRASLWRRMVVIAAGPAVNVLLAVLIFWGAFMWFTPEYHPERVIVGATSEGFPAADAGIRTGDRIVSWNGDRITLENSREVLERHEGARTIRIGIERDGSRLEKTLQTRERDGRRLVGIAIQPQFRGYRDVPPGTAFKRSATLVVEASWESLVRLAEIATPEGREQLGTVVGVVGYADEAAEANKLVHMIGYLSLILAVFNLLPLLPLDGGHLLFGLVEFVRRGRPAARETFERASLAGLTLILLLFFVGLRNDIARF